MRNSGVKSLKNKVYLVIFWLLFAALLAFPLLWVLSVSFQPEITDSGSRYWYVPKIFTFQAYKLTDEIILSFAYSFLISAVAGTVAMIVALSSAYLVHARVVSLMWRKNIARAAISLFFLPAFAVYPGIRLLSQKPPFFQSVLTQLIVIHTIQTFPIAFILLVALFASLPRSHFDILLLETGSRVIAFRDGIVRRRISGVVAVALIAFATVWNEFYITNFITTFDQYKPFSVLLQMFSGQYFIKYSSLAAGATVSLFFTVIPVAVVGLVWYIYSYRNK